MRAITWFVLLFIVAVVAATTLGRNDGLVSLFWGAWRTDLSLNLFALLLIVACVALALSLQGLHLLVSLPRRAREWRMANRDRAAQGALRESLALYFGGRYSRAQKSAQRALLIQKETPALQKDREFAMLGHLLTAGSLHRLQDRRLRDEELQRAFEQSKRGGPAARAAEEGARLLAAEWALDDRDASRALELLLQLPPGVARRTQALRLKLQAQRLAVQPLEALRTARLLAKHQGFSPDAARSLLRSLSFAALAEAHDADQLRKTWQQFDPAECRDVLIASRAAARLAAFGATEEARAWLLPCWSQLEELAGDERAVFSAALVSARAGVGVDWLPRLEAALRLLPTDPAVNFAAGMMLAERELWGKARRLLEQAGADTRLPEAMRRHAWVTLARMAERQDDVARVAACYREAAELR